MKNSGSGPKNACSAMPLDLRNASARRGDAARIARVRLHRRRVEDVAGQHQRRIGGERIQEGGRRIGQQHHVGLVDALPAGDAGAVEHLAVLEQAGIDDRLGEGHVVLHAAHVGEAQVDEFDLVVLDQFFDVFEGHGRLRRRGWDSGQRNRCQSVSNARASFREPIFPAITAGPSGARCTIAVRVGIGLHRSRCATISAMLRAPQLPRAP